MKQTPREVVCVSYIQSAKKEFDKRVICGGDDGFIYIFDLNTGEIVSFDAHTGGPCMSVATPQNSELIYTGGWDGFLREVHFLNITANIFLYFL